jgi:hypothetical protein
MNFLEAAILGIVQGVAEWIPISSEGVTVLLGAKFFTGITITELIRFSLFLHLGTFFAALVYFREDVSDLVRKTINYKKTDEETKKLIQWINRDNPAQNHRGTRCLARINHQGHINWLRHYVVYHWLGSSTPSWWWQKNG